MPCPISEWFAITVTLSSAAMRTNAFGANTFPAAAAVFAAALASSGTQAEIQRPPLTAALVFRKSRRPSCCAPVLIVALMTASFLRQSPPHDGWPWDSRVCSAAANVSAHGLINIPVRRPGVLRQQHGRAHNLSALAVAALWHVDFNPRALQWMR